MKCGIAEVAGRGLGTKGGKVARQFHILWNPCRGESKSGSVWRAKAEWLLGQG